MISLDLLDPIHFRRDRFLCILYSFVVRRYFDIGKIGTTCTNSKVVSTSTNNHQLQLTLELTIFNVSTAQLFLTKPKPLFLGCIIALPFSNHPFNVKTVL